MRNTLIVIKHEARTTLGRRSFWIMTFLFPALIIGMSFGSQILARNSFQDNQQKDILSGGTAMPSIGYVDQAGLIKQLPPGFPQGLLRAYPDQAGAQAALGAGQLQQYYLVPADFLKSGKLVVVDSKFTPFSTFTGSFLFNYIVNLNLVGDPSLATVVDNPMATVQAHSLAPQGAKDEAASFFVPFAALFIFFFVITMSSGFMLQSVTKEKENRTVEILLISLNPRELMLGKVIGLGLVALLQMAIWLGASYYLTGQGSALLNLAAGSITLPPGFIVWALLYFILGFLLYASALGALGALAPNTREGAQFTFIVMLPLLLPVWLANALIQTPESPLSLFLSLFPLTAPTSMITRLAAGEVPIEQILIGLAGLAITTYLFVLLAARFFRADTLLSTSSLSLRRILSTLRG
jgi:ABC-2 type transport system permease protein